MVRAHFKTLEPAMSALTRRAFTASALSALATRASAQQLDKV